MPHMKDEAVQTIRGSAETQVRISFDEVWPDTHIQLCEAGNGEPVKTVITITTSITDGVVEVDARAEAKRTISVKHDMEPVKVDTRQAVMDV